MRYGAFFPVAIAASIVSFPFAVQAEEIVYLDSAIVYDGGSVEATEGAFALPGSDIMIYQDAPMTGDVLVTEMPASDILTTYETAIIDQSFIDAAHDGAASQTIYVDDSAMSEPTYEEVTIEFVEGGTDGYPAPATY